MPFDFAEREDPEMPGLLVANVVDGARNAAGTEPISGGEIRRERTERRAHDREVRESEERFRSCFDEARVGMLIISLDGHLENVNKAFCAMIGYDQEQLLGSTRSDVTHPNDLDVDDRVRVAMLNGEEPSRTFEKRYVHASGRTVWVAIHLTLIRDRSGEPRRWIAQVQDITERRSYERRLEYIADHDSLTGLLNRRSFERGLDIQLARVERDGPKGAVLMVDLDRFKCFNDTWGHGAGDQLLARIARGFQGRVRHEDLVARLGGDEFAVILPEGEDSRIEAVAEAFLGVVRAEALPGGRDCVTASIGIANFAERTDAQAIMTTADLAMYDAKAAGGNRWRRRT